MRDAAAHGAQHRDRRPAEWPAIRWHDAGRGTKTHDAADRGWYPQGPPGIGSGADGEHVAGERDRRTARGAAGIEPRVEGISGRAPDDIACIRAGAEFRHVGLAEND